jgi:putative transposase
VGHAWLIEQIKAVHIVSNGVYSTRRIHPELNLGLGIRVGHNAVEMLMRRAGLNGLPGNRRRRPRHDTPTAGDLVHRAFDRDRRGQLWVNG